MRGSNQYGTARLADLAHGTMTLPRFATVSPLLAAIGELRSLARLGVDAAGASESAMASLTLTVSTSKRHIAVERRCCSRPAIINEPVHPAARCRYFTGILRPRFWRGTPRFWSPHKSPKPHTRSRRRIVRKLQDYVLLETTEASAGASCHGRWVRQNHVKS